MTTQFSIRPVMGADPWDLYRNAAARERLTGDDAGPHRPGVSAFLERLRHITPEQLRTISDVAEAGFRAADPHFIEGTKPWVAAIDAAASRYGRGQAAAAAAYDAGSILAGYINWDPMFPVASFWQDRRWSPAILLAQLAAAALVVADGLDATWRERFFGPWREAGFLPPAAGTGAGRPDSRCRRDS